MVDPAPIRTRETFESLQSDHHREVRPPLRVWRWSAPLRWLVVPRLQYRRKPKAPMPSGLRKPRTPRRKSARGLQGSWARQRPTRRTSYPRSSACLTTRTRRLHRPRWTHSSRCMPIRRHSPQPSRRCSKTRTRRFAPAAVRCLGAFGTKARIFTPTVVKLLDDENYEVSSTAESQLQSMGAAAIPVLSQRLEEGNSASRQNVCRLLGKMGPDAKGAMPALVRLLDDKNPTDRMHALLTLEKLGYDMQSAVPLLAGVLREGDPAAQRDAGEALARVGPRGVPPLIELLRKKDVKTKEWARNFWKAWARKRMRRFPR